MPFIDELLKKYPGYNAPELVDWYSQKLGKSPEEISAAFGYSPPGLLQDIGNSVKQGIEQLPGQALGIVETPIALATGTRPLTRAADWAGEATGFQPGKWAKESQQQDMSPEYYRQARAVQEYWDDPAAGVLEGVKTYAQNLRYTGANIAQSVPGIAAMGVGGRVIAGAGRAAEGFGLGVAAEGMGPVRAAVPGYLERTVGERAVAPVAGGLAEGLQQTGQAMDQYDPNLPNQQHNALSAIGTGIGTGLITGGAGRLARGLGFETVETAMIGGKPVDLLNAAKRPMSFGGRVAAGALTEGLLEETPQSMLQQVGQNWATDRPLGEGVARAGVEGGIAGAAMGGAFNLTTNRSRADWQRDVTQAQAVATDPSQPPSIRREAFDFLQKVQENDIPVAAAADWRSTVGAQMDQGLEEHRLAVQQELDAQRVQGINTGQAVSLLGAPAERPAALFQPPTQGGPSVTAPAQTVQGQPQETTSAAPTSGPAAVTPAVPPAPVVAAVPTPGVAPATPYEQAVQVVQTAKRASIGLVQRALRVPYGQAAALIGQMEANGVVSPPGEKGVRTVLQPTQAAVPVGTQTAPTQGVDHGYGSQGVPTGDVQTQQGQDVPGAQGQEGGGTEVAQGVPGQEVVPAELPTNPTVQQQLDDIETKINTLPEQAIPPRPNAAKLPGRAPLDDAGIMYVAKAINQGTSKNAKGPYAMLFTALRAWDRAMNKFGTAKSSGMQQQYHGHMLEATRGQAGSIDAVVPLLYAMEQEFGTDSMNKIMGRLKTGWSESTKERAGVNQVSPHVRLSAAWRAYRDGNLTAREGAGAARGAAIRGNKVEEALDRQLRAEGVVVDVKMADQVNAHGLLKYLANSAWQGFAPEIHAMSRMLHHFFGERGNLPAIVFETKPNGNKTGSYNDGTNVLTIYPKGQNVVTFMHELLHAATQHHILYADISKARDELLKTLVQFAKLHEKAYAGFTKDLSPEVAARLDVAVRNVVEAYKSAGTDQLAQRKAVAEFVAYGLTNLDFQEYMKSLGIAKLEAPYVLKQVAPKNRPGMPAKNSRLGVWSKFLNGMSLLLTGKPWAKTSELTILDQFLSDTTWLLEEAGPVTAETGTVKGEAAEKSAPVTPVAKPKAKAEKAEKAEKPVPVAKDAGVSELSKGDSVSINTRDNAPGVVTRALGKDAYLVAYGPTHEVIRVTRENLTLTKSKGQTLNEEAPATSKAKPGADMTRMARLLGPQLYGNMSDVGSVSIKEIFQNAFDALKDAIHLGSKAAGHISVDMNESDRTITIMDDGVGMPIDVINKAFLTMAGTHKVSDRSSGGLGIAKMLFLFGNKSLKLITVHDGMKHTMDTTGVELMEAFSDPSKAPDIRTEKTTEPSGTTVVVEVPETYHDSDEDVDKNIRFPRNYEVNDMLENSPLLEKSIEVTLNGNVVPIGANFNEVEHTVLNVVNFPSWGKARIMVRATTTPKYGNVVFLSNGLYQFANRITVDPKNEYSNAVPFDFFVNIEPKVKADSPKYPFALNRKGFSASAKTDMESLLSYLRILYANKVQENQSHNFGTLEQVSVDGKNRKSIDLQVPAAKKGTTLDIDENDKVEVRDGRMYINNRVMPEITKETMKAVRTDPRQFLVDQTKLDAGKLLMHDNVLLDGKPYLEEARTALGATAVDGYLRGIGSVFNFLRHEVVRLKDTRYKGLEDIPVGISTDIQYYGVHTAIPFKGIMINPVMVRGSDIDTAPAVMVGTMIHELAHYSEKNHSETGFIPELQRLSVDLALSGGAKDAVIAMIDVLDSHKDVFNYFMEKAKNGNLTNRGLRLEGDAQQTAGGGVSDGAASERGAGGYGAKLPGVPEATAVGGGDSAQGEQREGSPAANEGTNTNEDIEAANRARPGYKGGGGWNAKPGKLVIGKLVSRDGVQSRVVTSRTVDGEQQVKVVVRGNAPSAWTPAAEFQPVAALKEQNTLFSEAPAFPWAGQTVNPSNLNTVFDPRWARKDSIFAPVFASMGYTGLVERTGNYLTKKTEEFALAFPNAAKWISYIDENFGLPQVLSRQWKMVEAQSHYPKLTANALARLMENIPLEKQQDILSYLDGTPTVISEDTKLLADEFMNAFDELMDEYMERVQMSAADKATLQTKIDAAKFSDLLIYIADPTKAKGRSMSTAPLQDYLGTKKASVDEVDINGLAGAMNLRFFAVMGQITGADGTAYPVVESFVREDVADATHLAPGLSLDRTVGWFHKGKDAEIPGYHVFTRNMGFKDAKAINAAASHAAAIRNTVDQMDRIVTSARYADATITFGSQSGLVYNSRDELEADHPRMEGLPITTIGDAKGQGYEIKAKLRRSDQWISVPSDSKSYGAMAGKIINGSVWAALDDIHHSTPAINIPAYNTLLRWFKKNKTVWSPGTHMVNAGSNVAWMYLHDIPVSSVAEGMRIYYRAKVNPASLTTRERALWTAFMKSGALIADYSSVELRKVLSDSALEALGEKESSIWGMTQALAMYEKAKASRMGQLAGKGKDAALKADEIAQGMYAAEDNVFRLAAFMSKAASLEQENKGALTEEQLLEAGRAAATEFLDYNIHARGVNLLKQTLVPFISWPYRALPAMIKIALYKPWKVGAMLGAYALLDALAVAMSGGSDEDKRKRKKLPAYMNDRLFGFGPHAYFQVPGLGTSDKPVYFKMGAFIPLGDLVQDDNRNGLMGLKWFPSQFTPNGPMVSTLIGAIAGVDPFTGQKLDKTTDSQWDAFKKRAVFMEGQMVPPALDLKRGAERWDRVVNDKTGPLGHEYSKSIELAQWVGLRMYQIDLPESAATQKRAVSAIEMEYKKELSRVTREAVRYPNRKPGELAETKKALQERMKHDTDRVKNVGEE